MDSARSLTSASSLANFGIVPVVTLTACAKVSLTIMESNDVTKTVQICEPKTLGWDAMGTFRSMGFRVKFFDLFIFYEVHGPRHLKGAKGVRKFSPSELSLAELSLAMCVRRSITYWQ